MGPLEMFFSAQSLLCAVTVVGVMKLITAILTLTMGRGESDRPNYKAIKWLTVLVLPASAVALGAIYGLVVPFRPDVLVEFFAKSNVEEGWQMFAGAAWGSACGQFAQTLYDRVMDFIKSKRERAQVDDEMPDPIAKP